MTNLNLDDILVLFENGERRYEEDPAFKAVADSLKMGLGVYAVLDHTLKAKKDLANKLALALERNLVLTNSVASLKNQLHPDRDFILTTGEVYPNELNVLRAENEKLKKEIKEQEQYINHLRD